MPRTTAMFNQQQADFINNLVIALTGHSPKEIAEYDPSIIEQCLDTFNTYIEGYFKQKFTKKDLIQLKAYQSDKTLPATASTNLHKKYDEAYQSFLQNIKTTS